MKLLSLHPADVDPRMICLNPRLYWSVIWIFGSVSKALKEIGGDQLYNKVFIELAGRETNEEYKASDKLLNTKLFVKNFVSEMDLEDKSHRYCCSSYLCNNLEDKEKFLSCEGCITTLRRKYCSGICQRQDSKQHKKYCTKIDSGGKPDVSKWSNKSNKKKKKKQF